MISPPPLPGPQPTSKDDSNKTVPIIPTPYPTIVTARLVLRPLQRSDLAAYHTIRTQYNVMKWTSTGQVDADLAATEKWMARFLPPNDVKTYCFSVLERKEAGRERGAGETTEVQEEIGERGEVIGTVGCHSLESEDSAGWPECGYMFREEVWGRGYGKEAMEAWLRSWWSLKRRRKSGGARGKEGRNREELEVGVEQQEEEEEEEAAMGDEEVEEELLAAVAVAENVASRKILLRCGFRLEREWQEAGFELVSFVMTRPK